MEKEELLSKTISSLRFPLTAFVVLTHFNLARKGFSIHGVEYGVNHPVWYRAFIDFFSYALPSITVQTFFFISGFLFFYHSDFCGTVYKKKLKTRVRTLLVPFILWNVIAFLNMAWRLLPCLSSVFPNAYKTEFHFSFIRLFNTLFYNNRYNGILVSPIEEGVDIETIIPTPMDVPMWYVRDLMLMVLLAPILYWLVSKTKGWFVLMMAIVWCFQFFPSGFYPIFFVTALFFFSWGAWYSISRRNFVESMRRFWFAPLLYVPLAILDVVPDSLGCEIFIHNASVLLGVVSAVIIASCLLEKGKVKVNPTLANGSFFVYALHLLIMGDIAKVLFFAFQLDDKTLVMLCFNFLVPTITYAVCMALYVFLMRYLPAVCNVLTGGR